MPHVSPGTGDIQVDGRLDDAEWRVVQPDDAWGRMASRPAAQEADMVLRYAHEGLYIGIRVAAPLDRPRLNLGLMDHFSIPVVESPRWLVQMEGDAVVAHRSLLRGNQTPWECDWNVKASREDEAWRIELFIPFAGLGDGVPPQPGQRWRINCVLTDTAQSDDAPTAIWGCTRTDRVEHGALLVFGPSDETE